MKKLFTLALLALAASISLAADAEDSACMKAAKNGCHNDRKNGGYHCH